MNISVRLWQAAILGTIMALSIGCASRIPSRSVDSLFYVQIGGGEQAVLARGAGEHLPILLWLHGGPGAAHMPLAHKFNTDLEESFIVVHWDQRGAGKSNSKDFDPNTMMLSQFVSDAHELTQYLKDTYRQERIYLLGHSWGSKIGLLLAHEYPDDYHAFIAVSQVVDPRQAQIVAYEWLKSEMRLSSRQRDIVKLNRLGAPPYDEHRRFVELMRLVDRYGGGMDVGFGNLFWSAMFSPYYRLRDYAGWLNGARRGSGPMWKQYGEFSAIRQVTRLDIPVFFVSGSRDMNTPLSLVREYHDSVDAPLGKKLCVIDDAAHAPFLGNPSEFGRILNSIVIEVQQLKR